MFFQKKKKKMDTYSEESIKYIPRAPMLSAKTNTTCREKDTSRRNDFNADGPTAHFTVVL